jgi:two-component system, sensor histidine kinase and response regulator
MYTILVIEDDESLLVFIENFLQLKNFYVLKANNGKLGLELANQYVPDVIICDLMMSDMDGYDVIKAIRKNPLTEAIPFIFLTGKTSPESLRQAMNLGADDYLTKPFNEEDLFTTLNTRLEKKSIVDRRSQASLNILRHNLTTAFPHEFRTPLQNIILATDYLESIATSEVIDPDEIGEIVSIFKESSQRLLELSQKFLFYSSLESKVLEKNDNDSVIKSQLYGIENIIKSVAQKQAQNYQRTEDLLFEIEESSLSIQPDFFVSLLKEIIDNSLKFSSLETPILIKGYQKDQYYELNIINQGRGFLPHQLKNIGAYIQFDRPKYEQQGSGLGLAIAQKILEIYQGNLKIKSIPNKETTIIIHLPLADQF